MMRLESNTIGNVDNPTAEDVHRAFHDEFEDVAGNIYALRRGDGSSIYSISGDCLKNFSLTLGDQSDLFQVCTTPLSRDQARDFFTKFLNGDQEWVSSFEWKQEKNRSCLDLFKSIFRKG